MLEELLLKDHIQKKGAEALGCGWPNIGAGTVEDKAKPFVDDPSEKSERSEKECDIDQIGKGFHSTLQICCENVEFSPLFIFVNYQKKRFAAGKYRSIL
jgi:hypothetical protein